MRKIHHPRIFHLHFEKLRVGFELGFGLDFELVSKYCKDLSLDGVGVKSNKKQLETSENIASSFINCYI